MKGFVLFCAATFLAAVSVQLVFCLHFFQKGNSGELRLKSSKKAFTSYEENELFKFGLCIFSPEQLGSDVGRKEAHKILKKIHPTHFYNIVCMLNFDLLKASISDFDHFTRIMRNTILDLNGVLFKLEKMVPSSPGFDASTKDYELGSLNMDITPQESKQRAEKYIRKLVAFYFDRPGYFIYQFNSYFDRKMGSKGYYKTAVDFEFGALTRHILDQITFFPENQMLTIEKLSNMAFEYGSLRKNYDKFYGYWYFWLVIGGDNYNKKQTFLKFFQMFSRLRPSRDAWKPMAAMTRDFCANTQIDLADLFKPSVQIICENEVHDASKFIGEIDYTFSRSERHPIFHFKLEDFFDEETGSAVSSIDPEKESEKSE